MIEITQKELEVLKELLKTYTYKSEHVNFREHFPEEINALSKAIQFIEQAQGEIGKLKNDMVQYVQEKVTEISKLQAENKALKERLFNDVMKAKKSGYEDGKKEQLDKVKGPIRR